MLPSWCFSVLLSSAVLGLPLHTDDMWNSTSEHDSLSDPVDSNYNSTSLIDCNGSFCNQTQNYTVQYAGSPPSSFPMLGFWLPTMNIHRLDNALRPGDVQKVDTSSPHSPGKK
ncbi:hypothetical protein PHYPO_G00239780 [Pangasianodon hypophthalmus]|uniref:Uncharacterized protein n=1 Tax=Pangasianodon hypophthalmus TaxID=310915 RepID=A0A5N5NE89_PANHP|nr:hypothetical protein PHYPO_G00239780 [Pangasianodon hypophthalmus]